MKKMNPEINLQIAFLVFFTHFKSFVRNVKQVIKLMEDT